MTTPSKLRALRRLWIAAASLLGLVTFGVTGYRLIEDMPFLDALYMTVTTVTTVGYGEVRPLSDAGRIFTMTLILLGVIVATYSLTTTATFLFAGEWRRFWQAQRRDRMIEHLHQHVIVCGYGRVGRHVVDELRLEGIPFVVIDPHPDKIIELDQAGYLAVCGDAAQEANLHAAGIGRARGLIASAHSDAENVFIVLTARALRADLTIVARADFEESEPKLHRAGANKVIRPNHLAGRRMVGMLTRPEVADFLDEVTHTGGLELLVEQIPVAVNSDLAGLTLAEARRRHCLEITVLAVKQPDGRFLTRVDGDTVLVPRSILIAVGTQSQLAATMRPAGAGLTA